MSGIEVLGAASAAAALLETAIGLIVRIREARQRQRDFPRVLDSHTRELAKIKAIVQMVEDEMALQTAAVSTELVELNAVAQDLVRILTGLQGKGGGAAQFFRMLVRGSRDEDDLAKIMEELDRAKANLGLRISLAHVGLSRGIRDVMVVNTAILKRVDARVRSVVGEEQGLKLAELVRDRPPQENGTIALSNEDLRSLVAASAQPPSRADLVNVIASNVTKDQAIQINGSVGEQDWYCISRVEVRDNQAVGGIIQVNGNMSPKALSILLKASEQRGRRI
ncbi:hypothetical protein MMYC01_203610 [Madurella mycetomatis]|uniref:Fungal N-terminal domain-containing protein n=1 Tax=Madurella mycetomatis TaxID=100816 RepID=A0A175W9Z9_9PEZI|nr:hypothetical protein MMYC01_203610 [Madurella mycetomatis]